jgi:hypothetical protein
MFHQVFTISFFVQFLSLSSSTSIAFLDVGKGSFHRIQSKTNNFAQDAAESGTTGSTAFPMDSICADDLKSIQGSVAALNRETIQIENCIMFLE